MISLDIFLLDMYLQGSMCFSRTHIVHSDKPDFRTVYEELKKGCFQNTYYNMDEEQFKKIEFLAISKKEFHITIDKLIKIFENEENTIALSIREIKLNDSGSKKNRVSR